MPDLQEVTPETDLEQPSPPQPPSNAKPGFFERPEGRRTAIAVLCVFGLLIFVYGFFYLKFARIIDRRLAGGAFADTISIFTAPRSIAVGDSITPEEIVARLRRNGYTTSRGNTLGWYNLRAHAVEIFPGRDSIAGGESGLLEFADGKVSRIVSLQDNTERSALVLEPQLITNLSDQRERRHLVRFSDIPATLVHAVISVEDKHFFRHSGVDISRMLKAAYVDLRDGRKAEGASTLTMQLARSFWLDSDKRWKRKTEEVLMTMHLEEKLSKQQIFEYYANEVYLGRRGTFGIRGFGEGARAFFGKDLSQLTIPEAALLAGIVQRPSFDNPFRYPDRARDRRNVVLSLMRQNGYLTDAQYREAAATPVKITPEQSEGIESQYFVDLMNDELQSKLGEQDKHARYVYTTIDPDLQAAAQEAVRLGMDNVDLQLRKSRKKNAPASPESQPQVALIAMDPHTGEIKALIGGRNYRDSQLNHVLSMRQPGSVFKPFVYAAALDTAVTGGKQIFTPATILSDEPTSFSFNHASYQPGNFHQEFMGDVTLRTALAHSLNVATVQLAQKVGFANVVAMARRAGLNDAIKATPAVALGAYETTPLEIAGAYTLFANHGTRITPTTISLTRGPDGTVLYQRQPDQQAALDPRVAYLMVNLMQEVLRSGTGAGVRSRGFTLPAAGKTGTSRDGWFAGFTSELLCVVWVGFDDNRELNLEGARSALPIWAEFMKRASRFREYRDAKAFQAPSGVASVRICNDSGQLAGDFCPNVHSEAFIDGTQPVVECELHSLGQQQFSDRAVDLMETEPRPTAVEAKPATSQTPPPTAPVAKTVPPDGGH